MLQLCGTIRVALVWLTALTTLVSGTPHLTCVCPDGHVKLFCLSAYPGLGAFCCGGAGRTADGSKHNCCCARHDGSSSEPGQERACCRTNQGRRGPVPSRLEGSGCRKTLTPSTSFAVPAASADKHSAAATGAAPFASRVAASFAGPRLSFRNAAAPPPRSPGALVFALQRLLI